jgi:hypothetical protein
LKLPLQDAVKICEDYQLAHPTNSLRRLTLELTDDKIADPRLRKQHLKFPHVDELEIISHKAVPILATMAHLDLENLRRLTVIDSMMTDHTALGSPAFLSPGQKIPVKARELILKVNHGSSVDWLFRDLSLPELARLKITHHDGFKDTEMWDTRMSSSARQYPDVFKRLDRLDISVSGSNQDHIKTLYHRLVNLRSLKLRFKAEEEFGCHGTTWIEDIAEIGNPLRGLKELAVYHPELSSSGKDLWITALARLVQRPKRLQSLHLACPFEITDSIKEQARMLGISLKYTMIDWSNWKN